MNPRYPEHSAEEAAAASVGRSVPVSRSTPQTICADTVRTAVLPSRRFKVEVDQTMKYCRPPGRRKWMIRNEAMTVINSSTASRPPLLEAGTDARSVSNAGGSSSSAVFAHFAGKFG